jgi:hypothetical protein
LAIHESSRSKATSWGKQQVIKGTIVQFLNKLLALADRDTAGR